MSQPFILELLRMHVPLTLLCDLADPAGPPSYEIARHERRLSGTLTSARAGATPSPVVTGG